jgi:hypothetical protein
MEKVRLCVLLLGLFQIPDLPTALASDSDTIAHHSYYAFTTTAHSGYLLPTWSFVRGMLRTEGRDFCRFEDVSVQMIRQTIGEKPIDQIFRYPRYGFGVYTGKFFCDEYLTTPLGAFGIFQGNVARWNLLSLDYDIVFGLTGHWNHYDPASGNYNTTLADDFTTHVAFGIRLNGSIGNHWEVGLGYSFAHFSNGAMDIPNFGLNMAAPQLCMTYLPQNTRDKRIRRVIPPYVPNTYLDIALYGGEKNLPYPECDLDTAHSFYGFHYPQFGITAVLNRNLGYVVAVGLGLHLGYDASKNARYRELNGATLPDFRFRAANLNLGIVPSCEFNYDKVAFVLQPCFSILKHETTFKKPDFFGKFGLKWKLLDETYAGIQLHTFKLHADFIEFSLGYRLRLTRRSN